MLTLAEIQTEAYAIACSKGWHDKPLRSVVVNHDAVLRAQALMHTELTDAHDALDEGQDALYFDDAKPEGLPAEIADLVIRVCDVTKALGLTLPEQPHAHWLERVKGMRPAWEIQRQPSTYTRDQCAVLWLSDVRRYIDNASEAARVDDWARYTDSIVAAALYAASIVAGYGHDLHAAIEAKMAYNKTRPHRHGNKQA